jgi:hypothetical protein
MQLGMLAQALVQPAGADLDTTYTNNEIHDT